MIDTYPEIQYLTTGSSSFDLSDALSEPLTGRNVKFIMYPVSLIELSLHFNRFQKDEMMENLLLLGSYPDIIDRPVSQKLMLLDELTSDYLFRDVLHFENIRRSDVLVNLLKAIALQTGSEVSMRELSSLLKVAVETVQRYILLLEQSLNCFHCRHSAGTFGMKYQKGEGTISTIWAFVTICSKILLPYPIGMI